MLKIDDLLREKNLTPEELELHKDLIAECRERERIIGENSKTTQENLGKLSTSLVAIANSLTEIVNVSDGITLAMMPEEAFHRA